MTRTFNMILYKIQALRERASIPNRRRVLGTNPTRPVTNKTDVTAIHHTRILKFISIIEERPRGRKLTAPRLEVEQLRGRDRVGGEAVAGGGRRGGGDGARLPPEGVHAVGVRLVRHARAQRGAPGVQVRAVGAQRQRRARLHARRRAGRQRRPQVVAARERELRRRVRC